MLGTAIVTVLNARPWSNQLRALCDNGSQINLITIKAIKKLGLAPENISMKMVGAQDTVLGEARGRVVLQIAIPQSNKSIRSTFYIVPRITKNLPLFQIDQNKPEFKALQLADPHYGIPNEVEALFGMRVWIQILLPNVIRTSDHAAIAQSTKLGYVVMQAGKQPSLPLSKCLLTIPYVTNIAAIGEHTEPVSNEHILQSMQRFWLLENIPDEPHLSPEERECERIFSETHSRESDGRYIVRMPLNEKINLLGRSKRIALHQLFAMERKMTKNEKFSADYHAYMREFENSGYMSKIHEEAEDGYYTPHHGVYGAGKDKIRIVYNSSCKTTSGISLNECQLVGAKLQDDLADTLMRFRTYQIGISADVKQMYCQIAMHEDHKKYQKLLWRDSPDKPVQVYQLDRVIFGQTAAPFLAIRAMQQCAIDHEQESPEAAEKVLNSFYVDDLLTGSHSTGEAINLTSQITTILSKGKFELAKWCSNDTAVNQAAIDMPQIIEIRDPEAKSVLGLQWIPSEDVLTFKVRLSPDNQILTKRTILSQIGKLYDPNGYIAPVVVTAKILIQRLWKLALDWDERVPNHIEQQWSEFKSTISDIGQIKIPRWLGTSPRNSVQLHAFSDASMNAYACVIYARTLREDGTHAVTLIQSKTRVAPLRTISIPRLELCGAHLLAKLFKSIYTALQLPISRCYCWTDSEVVAHWINKSPSDLKTFVANRVAYIQHETIERGAQWRWVSGTENPADLASRGVTPTCLRDAKLWWSGPSWLSKNESEWPATIMHDAQQNSDVMAEVRLLHTLAGHETKSNELIRGPWHTHRQPTPPTTLLDTYGELSKLINVLAWTQRAVHNFKAAIRRYKIKKRTGPITPAEREEAKFTAARFDQERFLATELKQSKAESGKANPNKDQSIWYDPKSRLLRMFGRIISENFTFDERFPILLSQKGKMARLLLRDVHKRTLHGGTQQMLQLVRQQFWIFKARQLAKSVTQSCPTCFRHRMKPSQQLMATLPPSRTTPNRPFQRCGVDYMGPVGIASRVGRRPVITKGYVCLFVCFATRAIHLELVSDASTHQFIQAFRRFIAKRGQVSEIWSDNGTNFVGANNYLQKIFEKQDEWATGSTSEKLKIKWHFIIPNAPSWGGLWEAGVKSIKKHLTRVIGTQNLTFEEYGTLLAQVEACVNSRPIVPLSDDPTDISALTPAHFLIGESSITLAEPRSFENDKLPYLKRWEMLQKMHQDIWRRWHDEYILSLNNRTKWRKEMRNLQTNDLVIIREDNMPPSRWRLGRVIEIYPSKDGLVRGVKLRTIQGEYSRPITKLGLLIPSHEDPHQLNETTNSKLEIRENRDEHNSKNVNNQKAPRTRLRVRLNRLSKIELSNLTK